MNKTLGIPSFFTSEYHKIGEEIVYEHEIVDLGEDLNLDNKSFLFKQIYMNKQLYSSLESFKKHFDLAYIKGIVAYDKKNKSIVELKSIQFNKIEPFDYELNKYFTCYFFENNKAWFSKSPSGKVRYFSSFGNVKKGYKASSIDFIDFLQLVHRKNFIEILKEVSVFEENSELENKSIYYFDKLSKEFPILNKVKNLYYLIVNERLNSESEFYHLYETNEDYYKINKKYLMDRLGVSHTTINNHTNLLVHFGFLDYQKLDDLPQEKEEVNQVEQLSFNFEELDNKVKVGRNTTTYTTLNLITKSNFSYFRDKCLDLSSKDYRVKDFYLDVLPKKYKANSAKEKLLNYFHTRLVVKGNILTLPVIKNRFRKEPKVMAYFNKHQKEFKNHPNWEYRRLTNKEREFYELKTNQYVFIKKSLEQ